VSYVSQHAAVLCVDAAQSTRSAESRTAEVYARRNDARCCEYVDDSAYDVCVVFNFHVRRSVTRLYEAAFATADSLVDEYGVTNFVPYSKPKRVSTTAVEVCVH
jgi:hypothetical protein